MNRGAIGSDERDRLQDKYDDLDDWSAEKKKALLRRYNSLDRWRNEVDEIINQEVRSFNKFTQESIEFNESYKASRSQVTKMLNNRN